MSASPESMSSSRGPSADAGPSAPAAAGAPGGERPAVRGVVRSVPPPTRYIAALISGLIWAVPFVVLAWPAVWPPAKADHLVSAFVLVSLLMSSAIPAVADPTSYALRTDRDVLQRVVPIASFAGLLCAGLDTARLHLSDVLPFGIRLAALLVLMGAYALRIWAVLVNTYFSGPVTIQAERGHRVIDRGPYRWVRHPGNLAAIVLLLMGPVVLNSLVALAPVGVAAGAVLMRCHTEDRFLLANLGGYREYAGRVRFRMVPGIY